MTDDKTGYLPAGHERLFEADLYIAAMGRSGSTWLSNLLTQPPTHWILTEPWFVNGVFPSTIRAKGEEFGWPTDDAHWFLPAAQRDRTHFEARYRDFLAPRLRQLDRWGVKEVRGDFHLPTIATINPKRIVILVRDIRDVARSLLEKWQRQGAVPNRGPEWIEGYCATSTKALLDLQSAVAGSGTRVVRYEDLLATPAALTELGDWLDWPLQGDPFSGLDAYGRGYEIERHSAGGAPADRTLPDGAEAVVARIAEAERAYQSAFDYP